MHCSCYFHVLQLHFRDVLVMLLPILEQLNLCRVPLKGHTHPTLVNTLLPRHKKLKNHMKPHTMELGLRIKCGVTRLVGTKSQRIICMDETAFDPFDHLQSMCTLNSSRPFTLQIPSNDGPPKEKEKSIHRSVIWFLSLQHQEVAKILNLKYVPS